MVGGKPCHTKITIRSTVKRSCVDLYVFAAVCSEVEANNAFDLFARLFTSTGTAISSPFNFTVTVDPHRFVSFGLGAL